MSSHDPHLRLHFGVALTFALMVITASCSSESAPDLESLGLQIEADIQPGATLELAVPTERDSTVSVATTPAGVTAAFTAGPTAGSTRLTINVESDTSLGEYNLGLLVVRAGTQYELNWPFRIVGPALPGTPVAPDPAELLISFGAAWNAGDWELMRTIATEDVVTVAMEWYTEGGDVSIDADNVASVLDGCSNPDAGTTSCEFLYLPPDGYALIFNIDYIATESGLTVNALVFGGDAG